jgi:hypothetical protein
LELFLVKKLGVKTKVSSMSAALGHGGDSEALIEPEGHMAVHDPED